MPLGSEGAIATTCSRPEKATLPIAIFLVYQCLAHYREGFGLDVVLRRNEVRFFYVFGIELRLINELINGDDVLGRNA